MGVSMEHRGISEAASAPLPTSTSSVSLITQTGAHDTVHLQAKLILSLCFQAVGSSSEEEQGQGLGLGLGLWLTQFADEPMPAGVGPDPAQS